MDIFLWSGAKGQFPSAAFLGDDKAQVQILTEWLTPGLEADRACARPRRRPSRGPG